MSEADVRAIAAALGAPGAAAGGRRAAPGRRARARDRRERGRRRWSARTAPSAIATASERAALKQTKKRQRKAAAAARALGADDADADILAALGFDPGYLETERSLGLQKDRAEAPRGATDGVAEAAPSGATNGAGCRRGPSDSTGPATRR